MNTDSIIHFFRENKKVAIAVAFFFLIAIAANVAGCTTDGDNPTRRRTNTYQPESVRQPAPQMTKDSAERLCASVHGVPKWWKPDRDYHNCVDRLS